eukprot:1928466-Amphidinium_carterae.1
MTDKRGQAHQVDACSEALVKEIAVKAAGLYTVGGVGVARTVAKLSFCGGGRGRGRAVRSLQSRPRTSMRTGTCGARVLSVLAGQQVHRRLVNVDHWYRQRASGSGQQPSLDALERQQSSGSRGRFALGMSTASFGTWLVWVQLPEGLLLAPFSS